MKKCVIMAGAGLLLAASGVRGADFTVVPQVAAAYDLSGNPVAMPNIGTMVGTPLIYKVDFTFQIWNLGANEGGFGGLAMDINFGPGLTAVGAWEPDSTMVKGPGAITKSIWETNGDVGQNKTDLKAILAVFSLPPYNGKSVDGGADPRVGIGEDSPAYVGSVLVEWDGVTKSELALGGPGGQIQYRTYDPVTNLFNIPSPYVTDDNAIDFGSSAVMVHRSLVMVPEAGTVGVLGAGILTMMRRRRRLGAG